MMLLPWALGFIVVGIMSFGYWFATRPRGKYEAGA
jgi:hypothetical protein